MYNKNLGEDKIKSKFTLFLVCEEKLFVKYFLKFSGFVHVEGNNATEELAEFAQCFRKCVNLCWMHFGNFREKNFTLSSNHLLKREDDNIGKHCPWEISWFILSSQAGRDTATKMEPFTYCSHQLLTYYITDIFIVLFYLPLMGCKFSEEGHLLLFC